MKILKAAGWTALAILLCMSWTYCGDLLSARSDIAVAAGIVLCFLNGVALYFIVNKLIALFRAWEKKHEKEPTDTRSTEPPRAA